MSCWSLTLGRVYTASLGGEGAAMGLLWWLAVGGAKLKNN